MMDDFLTQLRAIEQKWQKRWQESNIFNAAVDPAKPKWFFTVPFPYASGPLHIGHCRTYTLGDIFARYKRQSGFNVLWPMAFHVTGTPVLAISAKIKSGDAATWKMYKEYVGIYEQDAGRIEDIVASFTDPKAVALYFAERLMADFKRMGFSIDDTRQFTTADPEFNRFVEWQFGILMRKGYVVTGRHPILWCVECKNAVGEDDIQAGDEDSVEVTEFCGIKFRFDDGTFLVAATLRPETIFGATNVWIHPRAAYQEIMVGSERWIISREAARKLVMQDQDIRVIRDMPGDALIGKNVRTPLSNQRVPVFPAEFVDPGHATGVVYSVPAHAPYDYIALRDLQGDAEAAKKHHLDRDGLKQVQPISIIKVNGFGEFPAIEICQRAGIANQHDVANLDIATQQVYKAEFYTGVMRANAGEFQNLPVEEAKQRVKDKLTREHLVTAIYEPSRPARCRCGGEVIVAVIPDQYFLDYGNASWKARASAALASIAIIPPKYRQAFENVFAWLDKRPCARRRGLGTELPFSKERGWIIESLSDSTIYMAFYTIIARLRRANVMPGQLVPAVFDFVFLNTGDVDEVSKASGIPSRVLSDMQAEFTYWYPNDVRHTATAHISNHLSFAIFHHVAIFPENHWLQAISLNDMLIREGQKMGKSKGNVIPIARVPEQYSVDLTRFHLASIVSADTVIDWRDKEVLNSLKALKHFWDLATKFRGCYNEPPRELSFISKAFKASVKIHFKRAIDAVEHFNAREYIHEGFNAVLSLIDQYDEIVMLIGMKEQHQVIQQVLRDLIVIMAPVIPHICEELAHLESPENGQDFVSLKRMPSIQPEPADSTLARQTALVFRVIDDIAQILKLIAVAPRRIHICINAAWKHELFRLCQEHFQQIPVSTKSIMELAKASATLKSRLGDIAREAAVLQSDPGLIKVVLMDPVMQREAIEGYRIYLERLYKADVVMHFADEPDLYMPKNKVDKAEPGRPAIWIE
nr:leucine--tRNA ligase [Candidatus Sigynarchaeota archaeon]